VPAIVLRAALGELAELFVDGQRVLPKRALELGFTFRYETIDSALHALLTRGRAAA
jgi:NAD dependent epimerase/dehydratase family enzyme